MVRDKMLSEGALTHPNQRFAAFSDQMAEAYWQNDVSLRRSDGKSGHNLPDTTNLALDRKCR
jgi:hypothetical protein